MNTKEVPGPGLSPVFDAQELARLSKLCVGSTSATEFSKRAGLSRSFLSAVMNASLRGRPSRKSLEKMASPEAQPQNGITAAQLLETAGYKPNASPPAAPEEPDKKDGSSFLDEVQQYCAADIEGMRIAVQCMVGELIKRDPLPKFTVKVKDRWAVIMKDASAGNPSGMHICLPAFVLDEHLVAYAASAVALRLVEARREFKNDNVEFCVLTNSEALCEFLAKIYYTDTDVEILFTKNFYSVTNVHPLHMDAHNDIQTA